MAVGLKLICKQALARFLRLQPLQASRGGCVRSFIPRALLLKKMQLKKSSMMGSQTDSRVIEWPQEQKTPRVVVSNGGLFAQNLGKSFKQRPVLRDVSVRLQRGEVVGL